MMKKKISVIVAWWLMLKNVYFPGSRAFDPFFFFHLILKRSLPISTEPLDHVEHISDLLFYVFIFK